MTANELIQKISALGLTGTQARLACSYIEQYISSASTSHDALGPISDKYGSDKNTRHKYTQHYHRHFSPFRDRDVVVLELGIGGYDVALGGSSLRMWREYFPKSTVYGVDVEDKSGCDGDGIKTFRGSQDDPDFLAEVMRQTGPPDIIIDDASHINPLTVKSFQILFPHLKDGGLYAIEDLQTSYWTDYWFVSWLGSHDPDAKGTAMAMLKSLCDGLNYEEFLIEDYKPTYTDVQVKAVHFWHNLCIVEKGLNREGSVIVPAKDISHLANRGHDE